MGLVRIALKLKYYEVSRILYERYPDKGRRFKRFVTVTLFNPINTYRQRYESNSPTLTCTTLLSRVFPIVTLSVEVLIQFRILTFIVPKE